MRYTNKILLISLFGCLAACVSSQSPEESWVSYYDSVDTPAKKMRFEKLVTSSDKAVQQFDTVGEFYILGEREINIFKYNNTKTFSLVNLDNDTPIRVVNKDTLRTLKKARGIRFYDFGRGIIEIADYQSTNGLCQDFLSKSNIGVTVTFATNYYMPNDNGFIVSFAKANLIARKGSEVTDISFANRLKGVDTKQAIRQFENNQEQAVTADAKKLGRFLLTVVCK